MKKYIVLFCIGLLGVSSVSHTKGVEQYEARLIIALLEDLLKNSNLILPKTIDIQELVNNLNCSSSSSDSLIGNLDDVGSCLDSQIDVPDDINKLNLSVIALLKTILLDLRGCNIP